MNYQENVELSNLKKSIENVLSNINKLDAENRDKLDSFAKAAFRQIYEDLYETARKTLLKFIKFKVSNGNFDDMEFFEKIRIARQKGLINKNVEEWDRFRILRNISSHGYEEGLIDEVLDGLPLLLEEAIFIYEKIK